MRANFALDYDVVTVERPHKLYLMAQLVSDPVTADRQRRPLNLSLVIDRSGSMAGEKIDYTRQAAQMLVQNLGVHDIFSLVLYNDKVQTLLQPTHVQRKDVINEQIRGIKPGGTTNLSGGWLEGCSLVKQNHDPERLNRVILMSDGLANRGVTESDKLVEMAQQKYGDGVSTTTMGLGNDFNEDLMMEMANAGGGAFYFIESPESAPLIFQEELQGLLSLIGQNLVITLELGPMVREARQLNGYPMQEHGNAVSFRLGDVVGDEIKALVLELDIPALQTIGEMQIALLRFEYDEIIEGGTQRRVWDMPVTVNVTPQGEQPLLANPDVQRSVLLLQAAQARRQAVELADKGDYDQASEVLSDIIQRIDVSGMDDDRLKEERSALQQQADLMQEGASRYDEYSRKTMATQAFYTMNSRHDETVVLRVREQQRQSPNERETLSPIQTDDNPTIPEAEAIITPPKPNSGPVQSPTHVTWTGKNLTFNLKDDMMRVGRSTHNEIVISARGVSRFHAQIKRDGDKLLLEDVGSTNGTTVNGVALIERHVLRVGDVVRVCDEKLIFHAGDLQQNEEDE